MRKTRRRQQKGGNDDYTLHIVPFNRETRRNISALSEFFTSNCWMDKTSPDEIFFETLFNNANEAPPGDYIYVKDETGKILFAQLGLYQDTREENGSGDLYLNVMGTCTDRAYRGKGIFKWVLQKMIKHYKEVRGPRIRRHQGHLDGIILTADYKDRDGVTAQGRHTVFAKSGMRMNNYIDGVHRNYVKTEDGNVYRVIPVQYHGNLKPDSPMDLIVEKIDGTHLKIPITTVTGCYRDLAAREREECPFILLL